MDSDRMMEVLKGAIILERSGIALYSGLASGTTDRALGRLFGRLAEEEEIHRAWLERIFVEVSSEGTDTGFSAALPRRDRVLDGVLTEEISAGIASASFDSAAVAAARALEERAVAYYAQGAADARDPGEAGFYRMLSEWEEEHLEALARLERSLHDNAMRDGALWSSIGR